MENHGGKPICPDCGADIYYVQTTTEYWTWTVQDDWFDLVDHVDSYPDDEGAEIKCDGCQRVFSTEEAKQLMAATKENKNE